MLTADELEHVSIGAKIRSNMKKYFDQWLGETVTSENKFVYERTYGGLVSKKSVLPRPTLVNTSTRITASRRIRRGAWQTSKKSERLW